MSCTAQRCVKGKASVKYKQVQGTNDCSTLSKYSASYKDYFEDDFLHYFASKLQQRSPLINRGYYIRFKAITAAFLAWFEILHHTSFKICQIISLGAGFDTSYFRLKSSQMISSKCRYIEIDFPEVMERKLACIKSQSDLQYLVSSNGCFDSTSINPEIVFCSPGYCMLGIDMNHMSILQSSLNAIGIDCSLPTMFLSECAITYMEIKRSSDIIQWAKNQFSNSAFITYEQVYPHSGFGCVMRNHFITIGSPLKSLMEFSNVQLQRERYIKMGWESCTILEMNDFYSAFPVAEKNRIQKLELFDEYEMWHEKCSHYVLIVACQGEISPMCSLIRNKGVSSEKGCNISYDGEISWNLFSTPSSLHRFAHQVIALPSGFFLVSGGFGIMHKKHQRMETVTVSDLISSKVYDAVIYDSKNNFGQRMHHTMTELTGNQFLIYGGRSSPSKACTSVLLLCLLKDDSEVDGGSDILDIERENSSPHFVGYNTKINAGTQKEDFIYRYKCELLNVKGDDLPSRWRHSTSLTSCNDSKNLVIFGGCSVDQRATNDCYILNTNNWLNHKVPHQLTTPSARHSHSAVVYKADQVIITGGLSAEENTLNSVHIFDFCSKIWSQLSIIGLIPRYSHTSHIWKDNLVLIGGVNNCPQPSPGVAIICLATLQLKEFSLPGQSPEYPILLNNHSSFLLDEKAIVIGGGGSCFSFGTHFNKHVIHIDLNQFLRMNFLLQK